MTPENLQQLKDDIATFDAYRQTIDEKQVSFPLDKESQDVIHTDLMIPTGNVTYPANRILFANYIPIIVNGKRYLVHSIL